MGHIKPIPRRRKNVYETIKIFGSIDMLESHVFSTIIVKIPTVPMFKLRFPWEKTEYRIMSDDGKDVLWTFFAYQNVFSYENYANKVFYNVATFIDITPKGADHDIIEIKLQNSEVIEKTQSKSNVGYTSRRVDHGIDKYSTPVFYESPSYDDNSSHDYDTPSNDDRFDSGGGDFGGGGSSGDW